MTKLYSIITVAVLCTASPAMAGIAVPLPIAGVTGPIGLGVAALGYVGYRIFRKKD